MQGSTHCRLIPVADTAHACDAASTPAMATSPTRTPRTFDQNGLHPAEPEPQRTNTR